MSLHQIIPLGRRQFGKADFDVFLRDFEFAALQHSKQPSEAAAEPEL
jgi:hypothetical protein